MQAKDLRQIVSSIKLSECYRWVWAFKAASAENRSTDEPRLMQSEVMSKSKFFYFSGTHCIQQEIQHIPFL